MCLYLIIHVKRCQHKNMTCHRSPSPSDQYVPYIILIPNTNLQPFKILESNNECTKCNMHELLGILLYMHLSSTKFVNLEKKNRGELNPLHDILHETPIQRTCI